MKTFSDAFFFLTKINLKMGESYQELVDNYYRLINDNGLDEEKEYTTDELDNILKDTFKRISEEKPEFIFDYFILMFDEEYQNELSDYEELISDYGYDVINSLIIILEYIQSQDIADKYIKAIENLREYIIRISKRNIYILTTARKICFEIYKYLDEEIFGTITNCCYITGHPILKDNVEENWKKEYEYECGIEINKSGSPETNINIAFKEYDNKLIASYRITRVGYVSPKVNAISDIAYSPIVRNIYCTYQDTHSCAKVLAKTVNEIGKELWDYSKKNDSVLHILPYNKKIEEDILNGNIISRK